MLLEVTERRVKGIIHLAGADRINRYEFAIRLAREFGLNTRLLVPTAADSVKWYAKRPADSSLNVEKANRLLNMKPMTADNELKTFKLEVQSGPALE
jgi:dTDP-4-dehydrorhamnose reductase